MGSKFENHIYNCLKELFPYTRITRQAYVKYKHKKLFFDFYIKGLGIYIECQGEQHHKYVKHFHGNMFGFWGSQERDRLKLDYVCSKGGVMVYLDYNKHLNLTSDELMEVIYDAYQDRSYCKETRQ